MVVTSSHTCFSPLKSEVQQNKILKFISSIKILKFFLHNREYQLMLLRPASVYYQNLVEQGNAPPHNIFIGELSPTSQETHCVSVKSSAG
jgi:hypothetical protein